MGNTAIDSCTSEVFAFFGEGESASWSSLGSEDEIEFFEPSVPSSSSSMTLLRFFSFDTNIDAVDTAEDATGGLAAAIFAVFGILPPVAAFLLFVLVFEFSFLEYFASPSTTFPSLSLSLFSRNQFVSSESERVMTSTSFDAAILGLDAVFFGLAVEAAETGLAGVVNLAFFLRGFFGGESGMSDNTSSKSSSENCDGNES